MCGGTDAPMSEEGTPRPPSGAHSSAWSLQLGTSAPGFCRCSVGRCVPPCPPFLTIFILAILILILLQDQVLSRSRRFFPPCKTIRGAKPASSITVGHVPPKNEPITPICYIIVPQKTLHAEGKAHHILARILCM